MEKEFAELAQARDHVKRIQESFAREVETKYMNGYREHGGNLETKNDLEWLCRQIMDESIDQYVYAYTMMQRLRRLVDACRRISRRS